MAMVQVTNKKGEILHRMRDDPGSSFVFFLHRYGCWKRSSCDTINANTYDTISASGTTRQSDSNPSTNTDGNSNTNAYQHTHSDSNTNHLTNAYSQTNAATSDTMSRNKLQSLGV